MRWYLDVLKKYNLFSGRARRREYWMFTLFNVIGFTLFIVAGAALGTQIPYLLYVLAVLLPTVAVTARRLHDTGKSGWLFLLTFIPLAGLVLLVFLAAEGDRGQNTYGPDPRAQEALR